MNATSYDCIVIGGGIAGLTAGIYLSRFNCKTCIIDNKESRASLITQSHNFPAFPEPISGNEILERLSRQYSSYNQALLRENVHDLIKIDSANIFIVKTTNHTLKSKFIILATGVIDIEPSISDLRSAIKNGSIRHCLICDGYEASGKNILLICDNKSCLTHAFSLMSYTNTLSILMLGKKLKPNKIEHERLNRYNIKIYHEKKCKFHIENNIIKSIQIDQTILSFDVIYSALGVKVRSELAIKLGAKHTTASSLLVNTQQETSIKGLYAAGDVVKGINQMCTAASQGATAAIAIFNKMNK